MNLLKKAAAAVTAVALLAGMAVPAGAANKTMKLVTQEIDSTVTPIYGDGLYGELNNNGTIDEFVSISQSSIKKWRNGSVLKIKGVDVNGKLSWSRLDSPGTIPVLYNRDSSDKITKSSAYIFDGRDAMKIISTSSKWLYPTRSGNILYTSYSSGNLTFSASTSAGKTVKAKFKIGKDPYDGKYKYTVYGLNDEDYLGYVKYITTDKSTVKNSYMYTGAIDLVDINGKVKNIWKKEVTDFSILGRADDNIVFTFTYLIGGFKSACTTCMYDLKNAKLVTYESNDLLDNDLLFVNSDGRTVSETAYYDWDLAGFSSNYSNVSIAKYKSKTDDTLAYCLVDLSSKDVKFLSSNYKEMFTADGKIYLVKTYDDMWGYINADGKFLGAFDDAGKFNGKYAPVIKNGKAYLIDRNLKCVSEKISATSVRTLDDGLYYVENGSKMYLMTYAS